ncbi:MAG: mechanosensitive ion channel, partial [Candidatus Eisenbacteria bacterium]|nr:mechanosensitive ion channel [Candidatus Latescibacterota bacterium]MBD3300904.1 mechanosensitive ion channel [Candidatus Eisenbacteria bacterium]
MSRLVPILREWLTRQGTDGQAANIIAWIGLVLAIALLAILANWIAKRILLTGVRYFVRKSRTNWDDVLLERKVFTRLSHLAPALVIYFAAPLFLSFSTIIQRLSMVYMLITGLFVANAFLNGVAAIYATFEISRHRPIKGYIQVVQTIVVIFVVIVSLGMVLNQSPWVFLSGLGAMTAVLILVFKDSILGLVASIQ